MPSIMPTHPRITKALFKLRKARRDFEATLAQVQKGCSHNTIGECDYLPSSGIGYAMPPIRVCGICGLSEEGWGMGFKVLHESSDDVPLHKRRSIASMSREEVYKTRSGVMITDAHRGPMIRSEITLEQIIDGVKLPTRD